MQDVHQRHPAQLGVEDVAAELSGVGERAPPRLHGPVNRAGASRENQETGQQLLAVQVRPPMEKLLKTPAGVDNEAASLGVAVTFGNETRSIHDERIKDAE